MKKGSILFVLVCIVSSLEAQTFSRPKEWTKYKHEIFFTMGSSNFLGDLGGSDREGSHYLPADLNFSQTRSALGFGYRYKLRKLVNVAGKLSYMNVKGDDALTKDIYRHNRNLNFKSNIYEVMARLEFGYQRMKKGGGHYGVQKNTSKYKNIAHNFYGFLGIAGFYYNPKGRTPTGDWVKLRNLHTEGQGLPGGPKQYTNYSIAIPVGVYYKFVLGKKLSVGAEFCVRKTFTDYIDDVGFRYYDKTTLEAAYGPLSAQMADPNLGKIDGATSPDASGNPAQRGDKYDDVYMTLEFSVSYIFKKQRKSARLRSKF